MEQKAKQNAAIKDKMLLQFIKKSSLKDAQKYRNLIVEQKMPMDQAVTIVTKSKQPHQIDTVLKLYVMIKRHPEKFSTKALKSISNYLDTIKN